MQQTYTAAFATKTMRNRQEQAKVYVSFMMSYKGDYLNPTVTELLLFIQLLANSYKSPQTVANTLSGAKNYVLEAGGNTQAFTNRLIRNLLNGVKKGSTHKVTQAPALSITFIRKMYDTLVTLSPFGQVVGTILLFAFATFLRQSNVVFTPDAFNHMLCKRHVTFSTNHMWVTVPTTKTLSTGQGVVLPVKKNSQSKYCPVMAYIALQSISPGPPSAPLFTLPGTTTPVSAAECNLLLQAVAAALGHPLANRVSIHSMRRSASQLCAQHGVSEVDIQQHGTWASSAIYTYVPKVTFTKVPATIAAILHK